MINLLEIGESIKANAIASLERGGVLVETRAKALAPVREKAGATRRVRFKTRAEVVADRETRRRLNLGREYIAAPRTRIGSRRGSNKARIAIIDQHAQVSAGEVDATGGRLRDEITVTPVEGAGSHFEVMVVSPTPYAKFQEFGTRHNPASPYLRPALHESRSAWVADMRAAVRAGIKGKSVEIRVEE